MWRPHPIYTYSRLETSLRGGRRRRGACRVCGHRDAPPGAAFVQDRGVPLCLWLALSPLPKAFGSRLARSERRGRRACRESGPDVFFSSVFPLRTLTRVPSRPRAAARPGGPGPRRRRVGLRFFHTAMRKKGGERSLRRQHVRLNLWLHFAPPVSGRAARGSNPRAPLHIPVGSRCRRLSRLATDSRVSLSALASPILSLTGSI